MKPPISLPFGEPKKHLVLPGRLEWDSELGCLNLDYSTPFTAHLRFLLQSIRFQPARVVQLPVLPLTLVLLLLVHYVRFTPRLIRTQIYQWGICDVTPEITTRMTWLQIKKLVECNGDIFLLGNIGSAIYIPREAFADAEEGRKTYDLLKSLHQNQGENWEENQKQFKT